MNRHGCRLSRWFPGMLFLLWSFGLLSLEGAPAAETAARGSKAYYIVREGDCLWTITDRFYRDPHLWPAVWSHNPYITNPHWIYPGDPIYLADLAGEPEPAPSPEPAAVPSPAVTGMRVSRRIADTSLLTDRELVGVGRILAAGDERTLLSQGDDVYLQLDREGEAPVAGETYQILHKVRRVKHPRTGKTVGAIYSIVGYTRVVSDAGDEVRRARILASTDAVEVGDLLRRGGPPPKEVYSRPAARPLDGLVVAGLRTDGLIAQQDVCFLDKGLREGVEVGDTFWVLAPPRKVKRVVGSGRVALPNEKVALLVVIHTEQGSSTALVVESRKVFSAGYRVTARTEEPGPATGDATEASL